MEEYDREQQLRTTYTYDSLGNRLSSKDSRGMITYTYNERNQLVTSTSSNGRMTYTYDKRGNRTSETAQYGQENRRTYRYDAAGRLISGTRGSDYSLSQSTYTYNGLGQRINSTLTGPDKTVYDRDYIIDYTSDEYNDLMEYNTAHTQWEGDKKVHQLEQLYTTDGVRLETDVERYQSWSSEVIAYKINVHEDILGSGTYYTRQNNGYTLNKHEYDAFGFNTKAPTYNYDPEYRATEPYFTGHPYDGALNLYYAHNRFYDAQTGRWLSEDPIEDGLNWYAYCNNNPVSYVDVLGLSVENPEAGYYYAMEGSTGGWLLRYWDGGVNWIDDLHNSVFKWHTNFIGDSISRTVQNRQDYMTGVYETLIKNETWQKIIDASVRSIGNGGVLQSVYEAKYFLNGKSLWESKVLAAKNSRQNLIHFYAGLVASWYDRTHWSVARLKSIYAAQVEDWETHPIKNTVKL